MAVDLHTHTTHSDGTLSPAALVNLAKQKNLTALAITDHDIISANQEAIYYSNRSGIKIVPGVELSIQHDLPAHGHMHLLGLFIDYQSYELNEALEFLRLERLKRKDRILQLLRDLDIHITENEVKELTGGGSIGRPHIARLLIEKGYVKNMEQAFQKYLKKGAPAYVGKVKFEFKKAIDLVHHAGGKTILAHPITLGYKTYQEWTSKLSELQTSGLDGIEVYYPGHGTDFTRWLKKFAQDQNMLISGGTDFHGAVKPEIQLGSALGDFEVPDRVYEDLVRAVEN
jgi:predicted metal-dependent phosphoesterase TrpH